MYAHLCGDLIALPVPRPMVYSYNFIPMAGMNMSQDRRSCLSYLAEGTNMSNASFVSANALRSAVIPSAHTTNKPSTWHATKPAFYAAFYAGYEANGGSIE